MDRTYILHRIYTSENSAEHRDTQLSEMYPDVAGTKEAIGMSSWRFFNIGKYKNQKVKDVCYFNPFYVAWCLENWQGFSLTSYERSNYMKGLERQLEKDPEDQELILKVRKCKTIV